MKKAFLSGLMLLAAAVLSGAEFAKVRNFTIILPDKPGSIESAAAAELKTHLSNTFTADARLNGTTPAKINVFVGLSEQARKAGFTGDYSASCQEDKFGIYRNNNGIV